MEASVKYPLNPLAACFVPLSLKARTGNLNGDVNSMEFGKSIPFYGFQHGVPPTHMTKTDDSGVKSLDLICKQTTFEDLCVTSKNSEVNESVHTRAMFEKLIGDEASIDRSKDRTNIEKVNFTERKNTTDNCSIEMEHTSNMAENDPFEVERTSNMDEDIDSSKMNWTSNMANENNDSGYAGYAHSILKRGTNLVDFPKLKPGQFKSVDGTGSMRTKSFQSDYGTDVENTDVDDYSDSSTEMLRKVKSRQTIESEQESTPELKSGGSERDLNVQMESSTLSLYLSVLLSSVLSSKDSVAKTRPKRRLKAGSEVNDKCLCPSMFGWIIPFEYFGNPLNLSGSCKKNYVHITYERTARAPTIYSKSLDVGNHSVDSGHCSEEDEPSSSVEMNTLEQCSSELESIIKDVFDCVDQSLSSCEDELRTAGKSSKVWITAEEKEVFQVQDSSIIDDGYHPLLQEGTSEDNVDEDISIIEKLLGEALTFGDKEINKDSSQSCVLPFNKKDSSQSCVLPCSVWCPSVPRSAIDTYKRFVKKIDSEPINHNVADEKKIFKNRIYKRCFSANDAPKDFSYLASSWDPKAQFKQKDLVAFNDSKGELIGNFSSNFASRQLSNPLKGSGTMALYDGDDSLWQPLPDCVLSHDHSQKHAYKKARIMRRLKSVG